MNLQGQEPPVETQPEAADVNTHTTTATNTEKKTLQTLNRLYPWH